MERIFFLQGTEWGALEIVLPVLLYAINFGLTNRARGWGRYKTFTNRDVLALWLAISTFGLLTYFQADLALWAKIFVSVVTSGLWRLAVSPGWGEYFDFTDYPNFEIAWIDQSVAWLHIRMKRGFRGWLGRRLNTRLNHAANDPVFLDGVSFALRGVYYLPIYIFSGLALASWWFALPAALFWQDGVVYYQCKKRFGGDYVREAELIGGALRGLLFGAAIALALLQRQI